MELLSLRRSFGASSAAAQSVELELGSARDSTSLQRVHAAAAKAAEEAADAVAEEQRAEELPWRSSRCHSGWVPPYARFAQRVYANCVGRALEMHKVSASMEGVWEA